MSTAGGPVEVVDAAPVEPHGSPRPARRRRDRELLTDPVRDTRAIRPPVAEADPARDHAAPASVDARGDELAPGGKRVCVPVARVVEPPRGAEVAARENASRRTPPRREEEELRPLGARIALDNEPSQLRRPVLA